MTEFSCCAVIPTLNHYKVLGRVVNELMAHDLQIIIVDDGSDEVAAKEIAALQDQSGGVIVLRHEQNRGKGAAFETGLKKSLSLGFSHALQVDADGQHDLADIPKLIAAARKEPGCLVTAKPVYDDSMPLGRRIGRWVTHVWVWIETLSFMITDSMCGYRVYPVAATLDVIRSETIGKRMDFDTSIMVHLYWRGLDVIEIPSRVIYPEENTSNFDVLNDNIRITKMHTRLVICMLWRLLTLQSRNSQPKPTQATQGDRRHWSDIEEAGAFWGLKFLATVFQIAGRRVCLIVMYPILLFFYLFLPTQRNAIHKFLLRVSALSGFEKPGFWTGFQNFVGFGGAALDKIAGWNGDIKPEQIKMPAGMDTLFDLDPDKKGAILYVSHLGNVEVIRALASLNLPRAITVLVHTKHAMHFNRVMERFNPKSRLKLVEVTDINPNVAFDLKNKIEQGEWVVIAADRPPVNSRGNIVWAPFLGHPTPFAIGPYVLAHILERPVYMVACVRKRGEFLVEWAELSQKITLPRKARQEIAAQWAGRYANWLEKLALKYPHQWYNFFDFWASPKDWDQ